MNTSEAISVLYATREHNEIDNPRRVMRAIQVFQEAGVVIDLSDEYISDLEKKAYKFLD